MEIQTNARHCLTTKYEEEVLLDDHFIIYCNMINDSINFIRLEIRMHLISNH